MWSRFRCIPHTTNDDMFVYNSDKSFLVRIFKDENDEASYNELHMKIKTEGFNGEKGYFHAKLINEKIVQINVKRMLPLKPW